MSFTPQEEQAIRDIAQAYLEDNTQLAEDLDEFQSTADVLLLAFKENEGDMEAGYVEADSLKTTEAEINRIVYGTELTNAANITVANHRFKTTHFNSASDKDLTIQAADWVAGDWFVIRQFGEGVATIKGQNANVKLPDNVKTNGIGQDMYIECYKVAGSDKYFHIINGSE